MKIDMHVHTEFSKDSTTSPEEIVKRVKKKGLDGIVVTDHDTMEGVREVQKIGSDTIVIPGMEVTTTEGELLGIFIEEEIESEDPEDVIEEIKEQNGLVVVPHPFDPLRSFSGWESLKDIDGIEVLNSRNLFRGMNRRAEKYAEEKDVIRTAGSDAHTAWEIGKAFVEAEADNVKEFRRRLEKGELEIHGVRSSPLSYILGNFKKITHLIGKVMG